MGKKLSINHLLYAGTLTFTRCDRSILIRHSGLFSSDHISWQWQPTNSCLAICLTGQKQKAYSWLFANSLRTRLIYGIWKHYTTVRLGPEQAGQAKQQIIFSQVLIVEFPPPGTVFIMSPPFAFRGTFVINGCESTTWANRDSVIGIVTGQGTGIPRRNGVVPGWGKNVFCSPKGQDWIWDPPSLAVSGKCGRFTRVKSAEASSWPYNLYPHSPIAARTVLHPEGQHVYYHYLFNLHIKMRLTE
jgi:hypothetical protein